MLGIGLMVLFFSGSLFLLVKAQERVDYFRIDSASTTPSDAKRAGDETPIVIINRSGHDYFAPNKTRAEFDSFVGNAPNYVSVAECGDKVCSEGETIAMCASAALEDRGDCYTAPTVEGCGDGFCAIAFPIIVQTMDRSFDSLSMEFL